MKGHLAGAMVTKAGPVAVQVVLLLFVAHRGTLAEVGSFALASATAYLCANFAELGFATTMSVPGVYYGEDRPPLLATRRLRVAAAATGSLLYLALWSAGLGGRDPALLLVAPLPFAVALSAGYAGALNEARRLSVEGTIAVAEAVITLVTAVAVGLAFDALTGALLGIGLGRSAGALARFVYVRRLPQSDAAALDGVLRTQAWFALGTAAIVVHGQADMVLIGYVASLDFAGVYGPLIRIPYGLLLLAEALSWALFSTAGAASADGRLGRLRGPAALLPLGVCSAALFAVMVDPFLDLLLDRDITVPAGAIALFAALILVRFGSFGMLVGIVRAGKQREGALVAAAAGLVLVAGSLPAARAESLVGLAGARLASEVVVFVGYFVIRRQMRRVTAHPVVPRVSGARDRAVAGRRSA